MNDEKTNQANRNRPFVSRVVRELTTRRTPAFAPGILGFAAASVLWRTLNRSPRIRKPGMAFLIERWAARENKSRTLGSVAITLETGDPQESIRIIRTGLDEGVTSRYCWDYNGAE